MHVKHLFVAAIAALVLATSAQAQDAAPSSSRGGGHATAGGAGQAYIGANIGLAMFHDNDITSGGTATVEYKSGLGFAGALGYKLKPNVRIEGEIAYRKNAVDKIAGTTVSDVKLTIMNYGVNGYYDFLDVNLPVKPFIGLGLGYASGKFEAQGFSAKDSELSYQGILGFSYPFDPNGNFVVQYRYHSSQDFSKDGVTVAYGSSTFFAGITYAFSL